MTKTRSSTTIFRTWLALSSAALIFAWWSLAQPSTFKVIVHPDNPVASLTKKDVSNLFLKKTGRWDELRERVEPVDLDATVREDFSQQIHGRSLSAIKSYWQKQIFSGREVPPPELKTDSEVIAFVAGRQGAIGYVSAAASLDGVKEVVVVK